jgi:hypothetical protein
MPANWASVLIKLLPLAAIFALSPLSLIPALVAFRSGQPRPTGLAFMIGWLLSITALVGLCAEVSGHIEWFATPTGHAWARIGIGAALLALGGYRWLRRGHRTAEPEWVRQLNSLTPAPGMLSAGVLLLVNPVALFLCAAAGLTIGTTGASEQTTWIDALCFAAVAGTSVAVPILIYLLAGDHRAATVVRVRGWALQRHLAVAAGLPIAVGVLTVVRAVGHL